MDTTEDVSDHVLKIMVATDIHLGYCESNPIRGMDSFNSFEEILQLAVQNEVDFILLGGDLFHYSQPTPFCISKCIELLKKYCLGDKPIMIEFMSDASVAFENDAVNYEDPNLNVAYPVFTIHGNHDDPAGHSQISSIDLLSSSGLVNYFGKWKDITNIDMNPIGFRKGDTKLALYGLSHIRDERLGRLFREKKITINKPSGDGWFHLLVLHQNREERGPKNFIPASCLPSFIDLVIWGHEHQCRIEPEAIGNCYISQPGSSVATSLSIGESVPKHVGILEIHKEKFKMVPIKLKTVRPFVFEEFLLLDEDSEEYNHEQPQEQAIEQTKKEIDRLIAKATEDQDPNNPMLPLIRLIVKYQDQRQHFNCIRIGSLFQGRVANPENCIVLKPFKARKAGAGAQQFNMLKDNNDVPTWVNSIEELVKEYLEANGGSLDILSVKGVTEAINRVHTCADVNSFTTLFNYQTKMTIDKLMEMNPNTDVASLEDALAKIKHERITADETDNIRQALNNPKAFATTVDDDSDDEVSIVSVNDESPRPARGKGSRGSRARGTANTSTRSRGRGGRGKQTTIAFN